MWNAPDSLEGCDLRAYKIMEEWQVWNFFVLKVGRVITGSQMLKKKKQNKTTQLNKNVAICKILEEAEYQLLNILKNRQMNLSMNK